MHLTTEMPKSGQFIAVWRHSDTVWSATLRWRQDGVLEYYDTATDNFTELSPCEHLPDSVYVIEV